MAEAKRRAADRRAHVDEAAGAWGGVLETVVLPVARQVVQVLKAEGHALQIFTPGEQVRIGPESRPADFVELTLESGGGEPEIVARVSRSRGREIVTEERVLARGPQAIAALTEEQALEFVAVALVEILVR